MDTSNEYIKMCTEAVEIQNHKATKQYYLGDICYYYEILTVVNSIPTEGGTAFTVAYFDYDTLITHDYEEAVHPLMWLPRQDQLMELLQSLTEGYQYKLTRLADIIQHQTLDARSYFDTFEKILLTIYMQRIHNKWWDTDNNKWINI